MASPAEHVHMRTCETFFFFTSVNINSTTNEQSRTTEQRMMSGMPSVMRSAFAAQRLLTVLLYSLYALMAAPQKHWLCPAFKLYREYGDIFLNFHQRQAAACSFWPQGRPCMHTEDYSSQYLMCMVCGTLSSHSCVCVGFSALFLIHSLCV